MEKYGKNRMYDTTWRMKSFKPFLLLFVPVFFFFVFFVMEKKTKTNAYRRLGLFYGVISIVTFIAGVMGIVYQPLLCVLLLHIGTWALCVLQIFRLRKKYQQLLEWAQEDDEERRNTLIYQKSWRVRNSLWCVWSCIPLLGGLGTYFLGRRIDSGKLRLFGIVAILFSLALYVCVNLLLISDQPITTLLVALAIIIAYPCLCIHPMLAVLFYEEYMDCTANMWEEDFSDYPVMSGMGWRIKNSLWQAVTFLPYVGTMGLFYVGLQRESGKVLLGASLLCIAEMACVAGPAVLIQNEAWVAAWPMLKGIAAIVSALWFFVYILVVFYAMTIRWDMLRLRAWASEE